MKISVIVPFYNEEKNLFFFLKTWSKKINLLKKKQETYFDFYFIDDGSTDNSIKIINHSQYPLNKYILKKENTGHGLTCKYGYEYIIKKKNYDYILQLDSDNQCDPRYLDLFLKKINAGKKFVFGNRNKRDDGYFRYLFSKLLRFIFFLRTGQTILDINCPYRMMKVNELKKIFKKINKNSKNKKIILFNSLLTHYIYKNSNISWINITFLKRKFGSSKYNLKMLFFQLYNLIKYV